MTVGEAITILSQFQNNAKLIEYQLLSFCNAQINTGWMHHPYYKPLISLSTQNTSAGKEIELFGGVGQFETNLQPVFKINGKTVDLKEDGTVYYKFKTPLISGNYTIPIIVEYKDQDGILRTYTISADYTVSKCNQ